MSLQVLGSKPELGFRYAKSGAPVSACDKERGRIQEGGGSQYYPFFGSVGWITFLDSPPRLRKLGPRTATTWSI
jgi:hypothetical protein